MRHQNKPELKAEGESHCTMELESTGPAAKLSITHTIEREPSNFHRGGVRRLAMVISNLKSLLETGSIVLQDPFPIKSAHSGEGVNNGRSSELLPTALLLAFHLSDDENLT